MQTLCPWVCASQGGQVRGWWGSRMEAGKGHFWVGEGGPERGRIHGQVVPKRGWVPGFGTTGIP